MFQMKVMQTRKCSCKSWALKYCGSIRNYQGELVALWSKSFYAKGSAKICFKWIIPLSVATEWSGSCIQNDDPSSRRTCMLWWTGNLHEIQELDYVSSRFNVNGYSEREGLWLHAIQYIPSFMMTERITIHLPLHFPMKRRDLLVY